MVGAHVGHDCRVGNNVVFANNAALGGHVEVQDHVFLGGHCAVHQFARIGESAMVAGYSAVRADVIPFGYVLYPAARLAGINVVGMRRRGVTRADIAAVRAPTDTCSKARANSPRASMRSRPSTRDVPQVAQIIAFLRSAKRPVMMTRLRGHVDDFE